MSEGITLDYLGEPKVITRVYEKNAEGDLTTREEKTM